jgi:uracil-DNA glycosylase
MALVLQDWASAEGLSGGFDREIQEHGRNLRLRANQVLEQLLLRIFGVTLADVYATNAFPFIKSGSMSSALPLGDVVRAVRLFAAPELALAEPTRILAVGRVPFTALQRVGIASTPVPHPAARIGNVAAHERAWRRALKGM